MGDQDKPRRIRRASALAAVIALSSTLAAQALDAGGLLAPVLTPAAGGPAGSVAALQAPANGYAAFATGTVVHAGVGGSLGGMLDVVSSTAAATSAPTSAAVNSELGRVALPVLPAKGSYGQGLGIGVGLGVLPGVSTSLFGSAVAKAPPNAAPVEQEVAPVSVAPLAHAAPFRSRAEALSSAAACVLGSNLAYGQGNAADVSLVGLTALKGLSLGAAGGAPVSSSESKTVVVPGSEAGRLGLMGETTQVLGPVTLLAGTPNATTVELKGQWALRVTADGKTGSVTYGPQGVPADQALVVVRNAAGTVVAQATAGQMKLAGAVGLRLNVAGVGEIVVGEQPRARGKAEAAPTSGTRTEAAVDLVRVRLLGQDVRLGHMEAAVAVPPAGVTCPGLEVSMTPDTASVVPGADFGVRVRVRNPNEGTVSGLTVASRLAVDPGVAVDVGPVSQGNVVPPNGPGFKLTTPLGSGQSVELPTRVHVQAGSGPGRIRLGASATGRYGNGPLSVPTVGDIAVDGPLVKPPAAPAPGGPNISVGGKGTATAGASTGSGGRKPARTSAGVTGAAGPAASAAPVTPAPITPAPPAVEPAPPAAPVAPESGAPAYVPPDTQAGESTAAPKPKLGVRSAERRRWAWGGAAAVFLAAIAAAGVTRLLGGARR
ncbi:MAG TPA: hypothetical protein VG034_07500 [Acidimicrobiia bacterium]|nr:hypothetical protein [Acidimicrobiia bacterium]